MKPFFWGGGTHINLNLIWSRLAFEFNMLKVEKHAVGREVRWTFRRQRTKAGTSPGKGFTAPVVGRFIPRGGKESASDRAKGWLCWLLSPSVCVGEGTAAVYTEEPRFPRSQGLLEATTCWLSWYWWWWWCLSTFLCMFWLHGSDASDHPNQAFSQCTARTKGPTFPFLLCLLRSRALRRPQPTFGKYAGPFSEYSLCPVPLATSSLRSCTGGEAGVPQTTRGFQSTYWALTFLASHPPPTPTHPPGQVVKRRMRGTRRRADKPFYGFWFFVTHANAKKDG